MNAKTAREINVNRSKYSELEVSETDIYHVNCDDPKSSNAETTKAAEDLRDES